jgi:hypothetical protein
LAAVERAQGVRRNDQVKAIGSGCAGD